MFDTENFLNNTQSGGRAFDTSIPKVPPGEYPAIVKALKARIQEGKSDPTKTFHILDVTFKVDSQEVREVTGLDEPTVRLNVFLDLTESGQLDRSKGKNVQLGKFMQGLGKDLSKDFSFNDFIGMACMVKVSHNPNPQKPDDPYVNVDQVGRLG